MFRIATGTPWSADRTLYRMNRTIVLARKPILVNRWHSHIAFIPESSRKEIIAIMFTIRGGTGLDRKSLRVLHNDLVAC